MSHFSVVVIGDVESNMERFSEQDETFFTHEKENEEEYQKDYETHKEKEEFLKEYPEGGLRNFLMWWSGYKSIKKGDKIPNSRYAVLNEDETQILEIYAFYNENAVYDYYQKGYEGLRLKKNGKYVSEAIKRDIDFEGMKSDKEKEIREYYRKVLDACGGSIPENYKKWKDLLNSVEDKSSPEMDKIRKEYNSQEVVKTFEKNKEKYFGICWFGWDFSLDNFCCTEDEYVARNPFTLSYGVVKDKTYYSQGEMGWWGISSGDCSEEEWAKKSWEVINSAKEDELITILDCHI